MNFVFPPLFFTFADKATPPGYLELSSLQFPKDSPRDCERAAFELDDFTTDDLAFELVFSQLQQCRM
ncbi:hypothetical protein NP92_02670 [Anoxybacillus gonensis]|nr:hypothetical protein AFK25_02245 [Anoxybacillus gonensis]KGP61320.1 hypothetical protein NP92_02670 [Anoxybacillus gonensis]